MFDRVKDRKLVQWALAYLAAGWVVLQLFDVVAEPLGWSGPALATLVVLLGLGFAVVVVLAWYHGEQGRQAVTGAEFAIITTLLVLAGAAVWAVKNGSTGADDEPGASAFDVATTELDPQRIAVLPFENVSADPADAYFADGIHEEVISRLSKIRALGVVSRTSVLQYRDAPPAIVVIAGELGVGSILEGSVRRAGQRVRITAQLIDARTDRNLWSEAFERDLSVENVFAIQTEIANRVALELEATLSAEETERVAERPTSSLQAYEFWLRGNASRNLGYDEPDIRRAIAMYEQAVEVDPEFGLAFAKLARVHDDMRWFGYDVSSERDLAARDALAAAVRFDPDHPETEVAAGYIAYHRLEYESALEHFRRARLLDPNASEPVAATAFVERRQGRYEEAMTHLIEVIEIDPNSARQFFNAGETALLLRRCAEAEGHLNRALEISPSWARPHAYLAFKELRCRGDAAQAQRVLDSAVDVVGYVEDPYLNRAAVLVPTFAREFEEALEAIDGITTNELAEQFFLLPVSFLRGELLHAMGDVDAATVSFEKARHELEAALTQNPDDDRLHGTVGLTYAYLGRSAEAVPAGRRGTELMSRGHDAYKALYREEDLARILGLVGRHDEAVEMWRVLLDGPGITTRHVLRLDPRLDGMRTIAGFVELYR